jgi:hypothetical protein
MAREFCSVVDQFCECPPMEERDCIDDPKLRTECYVCGLPVCKMCSEIRIYKTFRGNKRVRMCNSCQLDIDGNSDRVYKRLRVLAGYKD